MINPLKEFQVNKYLSLKLEKKETNIYVNGRRFEQCKFLLLQIPTIEVNQSENIKSIDDVANTLGWYHSWDGDDAYIYENQFLFGQEDVEPYFVEELGLDEMYIVNGIEYKRDKVAEFWGYCSNLQAWYENNYDSNLLHSYIAFPLLKALKEAGDPIAARVFKEEIMKRLFSGAPNVIDFLFEEEYIDDIDVKCKINDYITVKLEDPAPNVIYVKDVCVFEPDIAYLPGLPHLSYICDKPALVNAFKTWCSKLKTWVAHDYDTRYLQFDIAFPVLEQLAKHDPEKVEIYNKEIKRQLEIGRPEVLVYFFDARIYEEKNVNLKLHCEINEMITLKLEEMETMAYIGKEQGKVSLNEDFTPIDRKDAEKFNPLKEFQNYCNELQDWVNNDYDTLSSNLHYSIVFPILKLLESTNNESLKHLFKREVIKQLDAKNVEAILYLIEMNYPNYRIDKKDFDLLSHLFDKNTFNTIMRIFSDSNYISLFHDKMQEVEDMVYDCDEDDSLIIIDDKLNIRYPPRLIINLKKEKK